MKRKPTLLGFTLLAFLLILAVSPVAAETEAPTQWTASVQSAGEFRSEVPPRWGTFTVSAGEWAGMNSCFTRVVFDTGLKRIFVIAPKGAEVTLDKNPLDPAETYLHIGQGNNYFAFSIIELEDGRIRVSWTTRGR